MADLASSNTLCGKLTAKILLRDGVEDVVISPGARSTPLSVASMREKRLKCHVILDERSAAFFALGIARSRSRTVALICTSGSAVANYLPAVVEASESRVPLLLLTADRPPELRNCQAGQAINQTDIFGTFARRFVEAPVPDGNKETLRDWARFLAQAISDAGRLAGPVHLNCPFREPLGGHLNPDLDTQVDALIALAGVAEDVGGGGIPLPELPEEGWIIAGPAQPHDPVAYVKAVNALSQSTGWPVLADALNPCRHFADTLSPKPIATYDLLLRNGVVAESVRPQAILQVGHLPTSKVLRALLMRWKLPTWILGEGAAGWNTSGAPAVFLETSVERLQLPDECRLLSPRARRLWELAEEGTRRLAHALAGAPEREPALACAVLQATPKGTPVYLASSMPVRDAEWFWPLNEGHRPIFFNRGANGIDGTLSTALGVAQGSGLPAVLYTGDLALLHDSNGFLVASSAFSGSLTVVCVNNQGGGIFHHLPIASEGDVFEKLFATPQKVDFESLAAAYGIAYQRINGLGELERALEVLPTQGVRLLEVRTDRAIDAGFRKSVFG